jgi:hypothetical protein
MKAIKIGSLKCPVIQLKGSSVVVTFKEFKYNVDRLKMNEIIHGLKLKGKFKFCEYSALTKARQRNVNQDWKGGSRVPEEKVYLDISFIKGESYGGSCF